MCGHVWLIVGQYGMYSDEWLLFSAVPVILALSVRGGGRVLCCFHRTLVG